MTKTQRSFIIFQREFLNHILIMHPLVKQYEGLENDTYGTMNLVMSHKCEWNG